MSVRRPIIKSANSPNLQAHPQSACMHPRQATAQISQGSRAWIPGLTTWRTGQEAETGDDSKKIGPQRMTDSGTDAPK